MGLVTDTLLELLRKQIEAHGTVVWYDPERAYLQVARSLAPEAVAGAAVYRYEPERGFVWLRRQLEPLWAERSDPPRLLVYVPMLQAEARHALVEFEVGGCVMRPGQHPSEQNTGLSAVARRALEAILPPAALEEIVSQVEAGQLTLAELDGLAEKGREAQTGAIAVLFGTGNVAEVALRFLADPAVDGSLEEKQAVGILAGLLSDALGVLFPADQGPAALRTQLARQVLITDLIEALADEVPPALRTFPVGERPVAREYAAQLAQAWRNRRDFAAAYVQWAERIQAEIGLGALDLSLEGLARSETFSRGETCLQEKVEGALAHRPNPRLVELAEARLTGFWAAQSPPIKARWEVIADAGRLLVEAERIEKTIKGKKWSADALFASYTLGKEPWCRLDTAQRHLERDFHRFELDMQRHNSLLQLVAHARQRYAAVADRLADLFTRAYADARFELPGVRLQVDVYRETVAPAAEKERVAYILVDALRFEMACELRTILDEEWPSDLVPALAMPPTITEVGMAALLPGAEKGLTVVATDGGRLAAVVAGQTIKTREDRLAHLKAMAGMNVVSAKLDQVAPLADSCLGRQIKAATLVVVTATEEIDGLCESNPALARRVLDDVLNQLRRAIKTLFGLGVRAVVITADHGYLFGERLTAGEGIDPPGGHTAALKRRVWVGKGGAQSPSYLRCPLSAFGISGELEIATPWNLSCFRVKGGAMEYFHGGLSLQEIVIPVLTVRSEVAPAPAEAARMQWTLTPGSQVISTRFFSVTVEGHSKELLPVELPLVRVEVRADDKPISVPVSASYGFQEVTKDVRLAMSEAGPLTVAPNTITLMITETPPVHEVTIHLLDATTGISLARLEHVPIRISI